MVIETEPDFEPTIDLPDSRMWVRVESESDSPMLSSEVGMVVEPKREPYLCSTNVWALDKPESVSETMLECSLDSGVWEMFESESESPMLLLDVRKVVEEEEELDVCLLEVWIMVEPEEELNIRLPEA